MWKFLKVAVTAVSLLLCVVLIVLWVRSYYRWDSVGIRFDDRLFNFVSFDGMAATIIYGEDPLWGADEIWIYEQLEIERTEAREPPWHFSSTRDFPLVAVAPNWFLVTILATIAAFPWIKSCFSLRTLFIVMTLFAIFFGMIAMSMRG